MWSDGRSARRRLVVAALLLAALAGLAACSSDDPTVEVSEGEIPDSIPADVPIPPGADVGASTVDHDRNRTELTVLTAADLDGVVRFYTIELVSRGFIVTRSEPSSGGWHIDFSRIDLLGTIELARDGDLTKVVLAVNRS